MDAATGKVLRTWDVGVAPVRCRAGTAQRFMSATGAAAGRTRTASPARSGATARVRVDARSIASEGSVSVIDLNSNHRTQSRRFSPACTPARWRLSPNGKYLVVRQRRQRHVERHRHAHGRNRGNDLRAAKSRRFVRRAAQRAGVRQVRRNGFSSATARKTPSPFFNSSRANRNCSA